MQILISWIVILSGQRTAHGYATRQGHRSSGFNWLTSWTRSLSFPAPHGNYWGGSQSLLRPDCSTGVDQIPVKYVKQVDDFLTGRLAHIINLCISNSQFPRIWKTARISSVPKVDNPKQNADYRPVFILPALSKVFERLVLKQLVHYIDEQSLLLLSISGFRKGKSTTIVLLGIGTIVFGPWRGVRSLWWSWRTIRRHLIP